MNTDRTNFTGKAIMEANRMIVGKPGAARSRLARGLIRGLLVALVAMAGFTDKAIAQEPRPGWSPFLGCWRSESSEAAEGILCLVTAGDDVEMLTIVEGSVEHREPFVADGLTRPIESDGCHGSESASFSDDRLRLYTASDIACPGEALRRSTGIISMMGGAEWLDVRAIEVNGATTAWSQRYRRADSRVLTDLGLVDAKTVVDRFALRGIGFASPRVTIDHVMDASRNVDGETVTGWLAEMGHEFAGLDAEDLIRMEDAGVPATVIDVVVAVSFPEHFAFEAAEDRDRRTGHHGYWGTPFYYGSHYGGWGYGRYGYYGRYGGYYTPVVVTVDTDRRSGGRVVAGRGYRGPRDSDRPRGGSTAQGGGSKSGDSGSGSSRKSTGRKAKPRGGR